MSVDIAAHARGWIGTPYHHQGRVRGAGADCLGLVLGLWGELYGPLPCIVPPYAPSWAETGAGDPLFAALSQHLTPATQPADGQVLLFRMIPRARAKHLGIQTQGGRGFIHACPRAGVVEAPLSDPWARRIVARFALAAPNNMKIGG
jgi:NlpC/P60 family putative phage cell wall peptidase